MRGKVSLKKSSADSKVWTTAVSEAEAALTTTWECFGALKLQKRREWKKNLVWGEQFNEQGLNALDLVLYWGFSLRLWCCRVPMLTVDMVERNWESQSLSTIIEREGLDSLRKIVARYLLGVVDNKNFALFRFLYLIFFQKVGTLFFFLLFLFSFYLRRRFPFHNHCFFS